MVEKKENKTIEFEKASGYRLIDQVGHKIRIKLHNEKNVLYHEGFLRGVDDVGITLEFVPNDQPGCIMYDLFFWDDIQKIWWLITKEQKGE